ncbi:TA system toxin CbtA family protein, partial [Serratia fonticola]
MNKHPHTPTNASPAFLEYQQLLTWLLGHCYGLELNDTPYHDDRAITQQIEHGIAVRETVNELVEKFDLVRIDRPGFSLMAQDP